MILYLICLSLCQCRPKSPHALFSAQSKKEINFYEISSTVENGLDVIVVTITAHRTFRSTYKSLNMTKVCNWHFIL